MVEGKGKSAGAPRCSGAVSSKQVRLSPRRTAAGRSGCFPSARVCPRLQVHVGFLAPLVYQPRGHADDDLAADVPDYRSKRDNEDQDAKKPPDGRLEHLVAGAGFEPTASGL